MDAPLVRRDLAATLARVSTFLPTAENRWWLLPASATLIVLALAAAGFEPRALPACYLAAVTPLLCAIDVREHRLPNRLVVPGYPVVALGGFGQWAITGYAPLTAVLSGVAFAGLLFILSLTGGMGMGDVKLAGVLGMAAGLVNTDAALIAPLAAFLLGGVASIAALRRGGRTRIPFGPFLLGGFWIALIIVSRGGSLT